VDRKEGYQSVDKSLFAAGILKGTLIDCQGPLALNAENGGSLYSLVPPFLL
jgi:hypothetical protein